MSHLPEKDIRSALPHALETERAVLAAFLVHPKTTGAACSERGVTPEWFYGGDTNTLFTAMQKLWVDGKPVDMGTLGGLIAFGITAPAIDPLVVSTLSMMPLDPGGLGSHLDILRDRHTLRRINALCIESARESLTPGADGEKALAGLLERAGGIASKPVEKSMSMKDLVMDKFTRMQNNEVDTTIIPTGLRKLDQCSALRLGGMPLLTGERKAGKSMLAINLAVNIAEFGKRVEYISLEMPAWEVIDRMYAKMTGIPIDKHKASGLEEDQYRKMQDVAMAMAKLPFTLRDDLYDLPQICAYVRQRKAKFPDLAAVFVDYAQLIRVSLGKGANREQEVAAVSRQLRLLSMELKIALVVLCQLNQDGATRESKALEQDCTAMWKLSSPKKGEQSERVLFIPFQRGGESAIGFKLTYLGHLSRVVDYAGSDDAMEEEAAPKKPRQGHPNERKR